LLDLGLPDAQGLESIRGTGAVAPGVSLLALTAFLHAFVLDGVAQGSKKATRMEEIV
jgi:hypothetical protein